MTTQGTHLVTSLFVPLQLAPNPGTNVILLRVWVIVNSKMVVIIIKTNQCLKIVKSDDVSRRQNDKQNINNIAIASSETKANLFLKVKRYS